MPDIALEPTATAQWQSLVRAAGQASGTRLDEAVEAYLVFMLMRFCDCTELGRQAVAVRWLEAMHEADDRGGGERLRDTADECLLLCGLFPQRVRRRALPFSYYVDLGRGAYHTLARTGAAVTAGPYEALSRGFLRFMELLQAMRDGDPAMGLDAGSAAALARQTGSHRAWDRAAPENVSLLDPARRRRR